MIILRMGNIQASIGGSQDENCLRHSFTCEINGVVGCSSSYEGVLEEFVKEIRSQCRKCRLYGDKNNVITK